MKKQELICICCPMGCRLTVQMDDKISVTGNLCRVGIEYGIQECTNPVRILTTSVKVEGEDGKIAMLSIKTASPIPKDRIFDCLNAIKTLRLKGSFDVSDIIIPNILGLGVDIVATRSVHVKF